MDRVIIHKVVPYIQAVLNQFVTFGLGTLILLVHLDDHDDVFNNYE
jgi:hypothetical protein